MEGENFSGFRPAAEMAIVGESKKFSRNDITRGIRFIEVKVSSRWRYDVKCFSERASVRA